MIIGEVVDGGAGQHTRTYQPEGPQLNLTPLVIPHEDCHTAEPHEVAQIVPSFPYQLFAGYLLLSAVGFDGQLQGALVGAGVVSECVSADHPARKPQKERASAPTF